MGSIQRTCITTALLFAFLASPALAQLNSLSTVGDDAAIRRLEQKLAVQRDRLETLEQRAAALRAQETDEQRGQLMRDQIRAVLGDSQFRESLLPAMAQAGYDRGFYIRSSDEKFSLKINGRIQFRWTHYNTRTENRYLNPGPRRGDRTGFDLQRTRLIFKGHAWTKDLTYQFTLKADVSTNYSLQPNYAFLNYRFADEFQVQAGLFRLASTRSQMTQGHRVMMVDRPMPDAVFGLGRGVGVRFWGRLFDKRLDWYLDVVNSLSSHNNRTITNDPHEHDNNPALLLRLVWHAISEHNGDEFGDEADFDRLETPALDLGMHYAFNHDDGDRRTTRIPFPRPDRWRGGGFGLTTTNGLQTNQFGFDAAFKFAGFSAVGEYYLRIVDVVRGSGAPLAPWTQLTGQNATTVMHGGYVQVGYFLPIAGLEDKLQVVGQVGGISTAADGSEGTWEYGAGVNYFLRGAEAGNNARLSFDVVKISEVPITDVNDSLANVNDDTLTFRVQLLLGF